MVLDVEIDGITYPPPSTIYWPFEQTGHEISGVDGSLSYDNPRLRRICIIIWDRLSVSFYNNILTTIRTTNPAQCYLPLYPGENGPENYSGEFMIRLSTPGGILWNNFNRLSSVTIELREDRVL